MVGGESAGGGLTAALTLYARVKAEVNIAYQMPLYPMIDDRMRNVSAKDNDAPVWNSKSNEVVWKMYLGDLFGGDVPEYAAAARTKNYTELPATCTFVGDIEPFRDETMQYVENLSEVHIPVDFQLFQGCYHGFDTVSPNAQVSKDAITFLMKSFHNAVENYFAEQRT